MAARDYHERQRADRTLRSGPGTVDILKNAVGAVLLAPSVLVVFLLTGLLSGVLPDVLDTLVTDVGRAVAVVLAAPPDRTYNHDLPLPLRVAVALVATLLGVVPVLVGLLLLVLPGLYVAVRLLLSTPAVMLGGHDPIRALTVSWDLMDGTVLATAGALVVIFVVGFVVALPVALLTQSLLVAGVVTSVVVGAPVAGAQAYLWAVLRDRR